MERTKAQEINEEILMQITKDEISMEITKEEIPMQIKKGELEIPKVQKNRSRLSMLMDEYRPESSSKSVGSSTNIRTLRLKYEKEKEEMQKYLNETTAAISKAHKSLKEDEFAIREVDLSILDDDQRRFLAGRPDFAQFVKDFENFVDNVAIVDDYLKLGTT